MERCRHHGRTTVYRVADRGGTGTPLLCVHGSGGTHEVWKAQLSRLASARPVIALDLSGHGASEDVATPPGTETLEAYAEDVVAVAEATGARAVCGNSLGGAVALTTVLGRGWEPDALVLAGSGARLSVLPDLLEWLETDFDRAIAFLHEPDRLFHTTDERFRAVTAAAMREVGAATTYRDFASCDAFDVRDRLDGIAVPTLALTGEYDELTPPRYHEYLADNMPNGRWTTVPDAAHLSMLEQPAAFNDSVGSFLSDVTADAGEA